MHRGFQAQLCTQTVRLLRSGWVYGLEGHFWRSQFSKLGSRTRTVWPNTVAEPIPIFQRVDPKKNLLRFDRSTSCRALQGPSCRPQVLWSLKEKRARDCFDQITGRRENLGLAPDPSSSPAYPQNIRVSAKYPHVSADIRRYP